MNNKGIIKYKESFIIKLRNFFKRTFGKKDKYNDVQENNNNVNNVSNVNISESNNNQKTNSFLEELRLDNKKTAEKNNLLKELEGNEEKLNMLSINQLNTLEKYYDKVIEKNNETIEKNRKIIEKMTQEINELKANT